MMNQKEIYYFTAQCLALDSNPNFRESLILIFSTNDFPYERFIWLCDKHLILPVLYIKLKKYNIIGFLPSEVSSHLKYIYELNKNRNIEILRQVGQINTSLANENISPVYLKGTGNLLDNIYSDPGERLIGDIDMLVKESDYLKSIDAMISLGYRYDKKDSCDTTLKKHFYRLFKYDVPAIVEIHRVPVDIPFSKKFNAEMIFADRILAQGSEDSYVPSMEQRVIQNFIHAQLSNKSHWHKSNSLRDLYDIYLLSNNVSLIPLVEKVEEKNKLISYIVFADRVFNLNNSLYPIKNRRADRYCSISDLFLKHSSLYRINRYSYNMYYRFFVFLPDRIRFAANDKSYRKCIFSKFKSGKIFQTIDWS